MIMIEAPILVYLLLYVLHDKIAATWLECNFFPLLYKRGAIFSLIALTRTHEWNNDYIYARKKFSC
jgi:hypothetical protein